MTSVDADLVAIRAQADQATVFYRHHLHRMVTTYRDCATDYPDRDRTELIGVQVTKLMNGECSRLELCNELAIAIDALAQGDFHGT